MIDTLSSKKSVLQARNRRLKLYISKWQNWYTVLLFVNLTFLLRNLLHSRGISHKSRALYFPSFRETENIHILTTRHIHFTSFLMRDFASSVLLTQILAKEFDLHFWKRSGKSFIRNMAVLHRLPSHMHLIRSFRLIYVNRWSIIALAQLRTSWGMWSTISTK